MDMDPYSSSGEKLNIKTRKPYTITKQRERWTEEEHNSFLEALKLYGRAWQRIEEHIGTKTAVQIRSHAQKFFTKLEKEAVTKGVSTRQAHDLEIPPPRPKRKPNYPYPRKPTNQPTSQSAIQILPQTTTHEQNAKTSDQVENPEHTCPSLSSENENSVPRSVAGGVFRDLINLDETTNQSYITTIDTTNHHKDNTSLFDFPESQNNHGVHNYPRHVPVQVVDGNQGTITGDMEMEMEMEMEMSTLEEKPEEVDIHNHNHNPSLSVNIPSRSSSYHHPTIPTFHPLFTPFSDNQENYRSFLHVSSTISSLIVSSLLQNPAAHAAATYAAKFWHSGNTEASSVDSPLKEQLNPETPSMAAIAAATVAAATAWWAAHGLLPVCTPFYPPFPFTTPADGNQAADNNEREKTESSSDEKLNTEPNANPNSNPDPDQDDDTKETTVHDSSKPNVRKQVDRSSCGSNTTSSSEIETDALEKNTKEMEEIKGSDAPNLASNDSNSRIRVRNSTINPNESWKEVSEEGRLAFQALFSRQVLPQSFSNRHKDENSELDLNMNMNMNMNMMSQELLRGEKNEEGLLTIGLRSVKLNVHHTGFKPYKRCSMEAKENSTKIVGVGVGVGVGPSSSTQNHDDKGAAKRMRFEAEAST